MVLALLALLPAIQDVNALDFSGHENDSASLLAVLATGTVEKGDADRFRAYLAQRPARKRTAIYLNSPGGNLHEGMALGRAFHELGVRTVIEGNGAGCLSACALAFLGGRDGSGAPWRAKSSSSELGFHSFRSRFPADRTYSANDMAALEQRTQRTVLDVADYLRAIGTDLDFLRIMFRASADEMNFVSNDEALRIGIKVWDEKSRRFLVP
ncbi:MULTISPECIES: hypothetical protein [unclassified Xanthobacter]|uniref:COG3904 family protein n=1 Tax=unclassified Xanthobacter TaxID=2623496 RepID=UPI001F3BA656|nr:MULTISPECIES: hypothetical protein [unclassified Xanthobacter]